MQTFTPSGGLSPASGLFAFLPPAITPKAYRAAIGDEIERLIAHLDAIDGDPDLEEAGDLEPSLGFDRVGYDLELDTSDDEPSLGSLAGTAPFHLGTMSNWTSQTHWAAGGLADAELDTSDDEDTYDAEDDPAERGIGDEDGLEEQTGRFDRSGDEPQPSRRPWDCEADRARRRLLGDLDNQARALAVRLSPAGTVLETGLWEIVR